MRRRRGLIWILLGILGLFLALTASGALNFLNMERITDASSAEEDTSGVIQFVGFSNEEYVLDSIPKKTGTITNQSIQPLTLRLLIDPAVSAQNKNVYWLLIISVIDSQGRIRFGDTFSGYGTANPEGKWTGEIPVDPGESVTIFAGIVTTFPKNLLITTSFGLEAEGDAGFQVQLPVTAKQKRTQRYRAK